MERDDVFSKLKPEQLVARATDFIINPDWEANMYIADKMNQQPDWCKPICHAIEKKVKDQDRQVALFSIVLLDTIMKNSYTIAEPVNRPVLSSLLSTLTKLATDSKTNFELQSKIIESLVNWAQSYEGTGVNDFASSLASLRSKGVTLPRPTLRFDVPKNPHYIVPHNRAAQPMQSFPQQYPQVQPAIPPGAPYQYPQQHPPQPQPQPAQSNTQPIQQSEIPETKAKLELLTEIFSSLDPSENVATNDLVRELYPVCEQFQSRIIYSLENGHISDNLEQLLALNDELIRMKETYDDLVKRSVQRASPQQPQPQYSQPQQPQQPPQYFQPQQPPQPQQPSLFDFDAPLPVPAPQTNQQLPPQPQPQQPAAPLFAPLPSTEAPSDFVPFLPAPPGSKRRPPTSPQSQPQPQQPPVYHPPPQFQPQFQPTPVQAPAFFQPQIPPVHVQQPVQHVQTQPQAAPLAPLPAPAITPVNANNPQRKDDFLNFLLE